MDRLRKIIKEEITKFSKSAVLKSYYELTDDSLAKQYFMLLANLLELEQHLFGKEMALARKELDRYLEVEPLSDPKEIYQKFLELYDTHSNVRFALETVDSIQEIRIWLQQHPEFYQKFIKL